VLIGNSESFVIDISAGSHYKLQTLTTTGGSAVVSAAYPGLAYDSRQDKIVAWIGGNTVYSLDMDTKAWIATSSYTGGPGSAGSTGTYKRWSYVPAADCFVLNNTYSQNTFTFRFPGTATEKKTRGIVAPRITSRADLYNLRGQRVRTLEPEAIGPGGNLLDAKGLPGGVYLLKARDGNSTVGRTLFISK
jgi:hypothetical protein